MCSRGVFLHTCPSGSIRSSSICSGVLERSRSKSVSVMILRGIRLRIAILSGRMSCDEALCSSITKIFSSFRLSTAGSETGTLTGIILILVVCFAVQNYSKMSATAKRKILFSHCCCQERFNLSKNITVR